VITEELRQAIAGFVGACAALMLADGASREARRLAVHTAFEVLCDAWGRCSP
jgi:gas vesicle protein